MRNCIYVFMQVKWKRDKESVRVCWGHVRVAKPEKSYSISDKVKAFIVYLMSAESNKFSPQTHSSTTLFCTFAFHTLPLTQTHWLHGWNQFGLFIRFQRGLIKSLVVVPLTDNVNTISRAITSVMRTHTGTAHLSFCHLLWTLRKLILFFSQPKLLLASNMKTLNSFYRAIAE